MPFKIEIIRSVPTYAFHHLNLYAPYSHCTRSLPKYVFNIDRYVHYLTATYYVLYRQLHSILIYIYTTHVSSADRFVHSRHQYVYHLNMYAPYRQCTSPDIPKYNMFNTHRCVHHLHMHVPYCHCTRSLPKYVFKIDRYVHCLTDICPISTVAFNIDILTS